VPSSRKSVLRLLAKIAKLSQVFPQQFEIIGVECDVSIMPAIEGGYGYIYKGEFMEQVVCVKAVRVYAGGAKKSALRVCPVAPIGHSLVNLPPCRHMPENSS
jgi:hypothetical protein